jgi:hypothetical protein
MTIRLQKNWPKLRGFCAHVKEKRWWAPHYLASIWQMSEGVAANSASNAHPRQLTNRKELLQGELRLPKMFSRVAGDANNSDT